MTSTPQKYPRLDALEAGHLLRALEADVQTAPVVPALLDVGEQLPQRIGRYTIDGVLGRGGSGVVYRAYAAGSDRPVALKVISGVLSEQGRARAARELEVLRAVRLNVLPRLLDYGTVDGSLYLATELIDGVPLDVHVGGAGKGPARNDDELRVRVELMARVAEAVQQLHEHGVIHRDLKPSNILVGADGRPVIVDLGLARTENDLRVTFTAGGPLGTVAFMAPEQARGQHSSVSTRADVYSLGATAYLLFTHRTPHETSPSIHESLRRVAAEPARDPRALNPALPKRLAAILQKACASAPAGRYATAAAFAADLRRWLAGEVPEATQPGAYTLVVRWLGRHPMLAPALLGVLIAVLTVGVSAAVVWWLGLRADSVRLNGTAAAVQVEVRSRAGGIVKRWEVGAVREYPGPIAMERPREFGGGRLFLVALPKGDFGRELCAFEAGDLETPRWTSGIGSPEIAFPDHARFLAEPRFLCRTVLAADVFKGSPGDEVVAIFNHATWGACLIRIYNLRGEVLFEAWHDGWVREMAWLSGPGLLVLSGVNSEASWEGRGERGVRLVQFPLVVFAVAPKMGERAGWVTTPTWMGSLEPSWYRCILPAQAVDVVGWDLTGAGVAARSASTFELVLDTVHILCDEHGNQAASARADMAYFSTAGRPEPAAFFRVGDLPPLDPNRAATTRPANR